MLITFCLGLTFTALSLQTTPHSSFPFFLHYRKEATVQFMQDNGPNYWATWWLVYDCFWNDPKGRRIQDLHTFVPHHWPPHLYNHPPPNSSWERHTVLEDLACFPLLWLSKATLLFSPISVSVFFIWLGWAEKAKIFDSIIGDKESVLPFWVEVYNAHY